MRVPIRVAFGIVAAGLFVAAGTFLFRHIGGPRIVGEAVAPDGTQMCIVQQCNWSAEPFTTSFVYRRPGGTWGRFYYDHQDDYWSSSRVVVDTNRNIALFYRDDSPAVTFAWATETYTMHRWKRTMTGAQWQMPVDWSPGQGVYAR